MEVRGFNRTNALSEGHFGFSRGGFGDTARYRYPATTRINGTMSRARLASPQSTATPRIARFTLCSFCISPLIYLTPAAPILMAGVLGWHTAGTPSQRKNDIMGHQLVNPD